MDLVKMYGTVVVDGTIGDGVQLAWFPKALAGTQAISWPQGPETTLRNAGARRSEESEGSLVEAMPVDEARLDFERALGLDVAVSVEHADFLPAAVLALLFAKDTDSLAMYYTAQVSGGQALPPSPAAYAQLAPAYREFAERVTSGGLVPVNDLLHGESLRHVFRWTGIGTLGLLAGHPVLAVLGFKGYCVVARIAEDLWVGGAQGPLGKIAADLLNQKLRPRLGLTPIPKTGPAEGESDLTS